MVGRGFLNNLSARRIAGHDLQMGQSLPGAIEGLLPRGLPACHPADFGQLVSGNF